jgi:hypothetical protein
MSPMMANAIAISPPAPIPWIPRKRMSWSMFWESPHSTDPSTKMTMADWNINRRP